MHAAPRSFVAALLAALALLGPAAADTAVAQQAAVDIRLFSYQPSPLRVAPGAAVTWTNHDAIDHSVTSGTPEQPGDGFDSGFFNQGESFSHTFAEPGEYPYFCRRHESMRGVVEVASGS